MLRKARHLRVCATAVIAAAVITPAAAYAGSDSGNGKAAETTRPSARQEALAAEFGLQLTPKTVKTADGPNPYLAMLPDPTKADYAGWRRALANQAKARANRLDESAPRARATAQPILVDEDEPAGANGGNDSTLTAQAIDGFGTGDGNTNAARVLGSLSPQELAIDEIEASTEDDGSIPQARDTGITASGEGVVTTGTIGDGPHGSTGSGSGDFDYYALQGEAGSEIVVDVDAESELDPMVALWDADGNVVAFNDDDGESLNSLLTYTVPADGTYYAMVTGYPATPADPTDSASGDGFGSEGPYAVTVAQRVSDRDFYAVDLKPGDVLAASLKGNATWATIYDPSGREVHGSNQDGSSLYPPSSPLPGGGNAVVEHVASVAGTHYVEFSTGDGTYDATVEAYRPTAEQDAKAQTLFLDFDGERFNTGMFGGPGVRDLSPFRAWLGRWGLSRADEEAVAREIIATVKENLKHDLEEMGLAGKIRIKVKNSYDHPDTFGDPNVSRIVIGGSIAESGINTIGIAQYIDPGNFGHEDSALVLLDVVSGPKSDVASFNHYISEESDVISFVGNALGNVVAHEAGHFLGNWHTDQFNEQHNVMDAGGEFAGLFGVGADGIGGTSDDPDVDFGEDVFNPGEGFTGIEDTLSRTAFGLGRPHHLH